MSLYNAVFGVNPFSSVLLEMLGTNPGAIPRFRDCFLNEAGEEIIIHTRTGGGNRDYYESEEICREHYPEYFNAQDNDPSGPWNEDLRSIPGFKYDSDDEYDATYANFHYAVPLKYKELVADLKAKGATGNPSIKWKELMEKLQSGENSDPVVKRALEVGESIMKQINEELNPERKA